MVGEERAGDFIEKYELLQPVAQGGMGSVWAARLHGPHGFAKVVAIKTVLPELAGNARMRAMFLDEARLASAIVHRNVAHVLDFVEHEGALYIVMEWVEGVSLMWLHERLEKRGARIPTGIVLRVLADVCAGLHAAHELRNGGQPGGLVHRDVSPQNVLVAVEGSGKLIDFGVAKTRFRVAADSTLGALRGRLAFMAPEQAKCDELDRRADVWSVGATLLYMLTGHGPFGRCDLPETLRRLIAGGQPIEPPSDLHPSVARVLSGCLARQREDRFPTAEHVAWAIESAIEDMRVSASASDVARFLAEQAGDRIDFRRFETGRAHPTGRTPVIPRDLTLLRSGSQACIKLEPPKRRHRARVVLGAIAACVILPALAIAIALGSHDAAPPAATPVLTADEELRPEAVIQVAPEPKAVQAAATPPAAPPRPHEEASPPPRPQQRTRDARPHAKPHSAGSKARSKHDGSGGTQK